MKTRRTQVTSKISHLHALQDAFLAQAMSPKPLQMHLGQMILNLQYPTLREAYIFSDRHQPTKKLKEERVKNIQVLLAHQTDLDTVRG